MTSKSTRRAAEVAIIDAAYAYKEILVKGIGPLEPEHEFRRRRDSAREVLFDALDEHEALGLEMPDRHVTGNINPSTSHAAGASLKNISGDARKVYDEIVVGGGLTCDQVEVKLNRPHQTVSARVNQLRDAGWITDSGFKRRTRQGRMAIVWRPTLQAINQGDQP